MNSTDNRQSTAGTALHSVNDRHHIVLTKVDSENGLTVTWAAYAFDAKCAIPLLVRRLQPGQKPGTVEELLAYACADEASCVDDLLQNMAYLYVLRSFFDGQAGVRALVSDRLTKELGLVVITSSREALVS